MSVVERSRENVEAILADLEGQYDSFPVTQQTVSMSGEYYTRVRERCRQANARVDVHVHNEAGEVLCSGGEVDAAVPSALVSPSEDVTASARQAVRAATGVECRIDTVEDVTIVGVHDESAPASAPIYRLVARLRGDHVAATPTPGTRWVADPPSVGLLR